MWRGRAEKRSRAIELRRNPTEAEAVLWRALRRNGLGMRARRQVVIAGFIADFVVPRARLVIEVDGTVHEARGGYDAERDRILRVEGYEVIRVGNEDVLREVGAVVARIQVVIASRELERGEEAFPERASRPRLTADLDLDPRCRCTAIS